MRPTARPISIARSKPPASAPMPASTPPAPPVQLNGAYGGWGAEGGDGAEGGGRGHGGREGGGSEGEKARDAAVHVPRLVDVWLHLVEAVVRTDVRAAVGVVGRDAEVSDVDRLAGFAVEHGDRVHPVRALSAIDELEAHAAHLAGVALRRLTERERRRLWGWRRTRQRGRRRRRLSGSELAVESHEEVVLVGRAVRPVVHTIVDVLIHRTAPIHAGAEVPGIDVAHFTCLQSTHDGRRGWAGRRVEQHEADATRPPGVAYGRACHAHAVRQAPSVVFGVGDAAAR